MICTEFHEHQIFWTRFDSKNYIPKKKDSQTEGGTEGRRGTWSDRRTDGLTLIFQRSKDVSKRGRSECKASFFYEVVFAKDE